MRLADEVRGQIQAFITNDLSPRDLEGWLDSAAEEIHADADPSVRQLTGRVYIVLAEISDGGLSVQDGRVELHDLLTTTGPHAAATHPSVTPVTQLS